jgi:tRNA-dihydrouridine synthase
MRDLIPTERPALVLAPMQDVTDLAFMRTMHKFGGPDIYVTEYFRVHPDSKPSDYILRSITENPTGRPVFAQMIGQDIPSLVRTAKQLLEHPVAGIDLNLGCPAPVVCKKEAGGGLLRNPLKISQILTALRDAIGDARLTVKTRLGYDSPDEFADLLRVFKSHAIDALTVHGRTVKERYQTPVHPGHIATAVRELDCPVIANGNIVDVTTANSLLEQTGAAGLMLGRGAIRNPWLFDQLRGTRADPPSKLELLNYIEILYDETARTVRNFHPVKHVMKMKRYLRYIAQGIDAEFEQQIYRASTPDEFKRICHEFLNDNSTVPSLPPEKSKLFCGFSDLLPT